MKRGAAIPLMNSQLLQDAIEHYQAGRLAQSEQLCHEAFAGDPGNAACLNLLGKINYQLDRYATATTLLREAVRKAPGVAEYHYDLGRNLELESNLVEAEAHYRRALALNSDYKDAYKKLGNVLHAQRNFDEAASCFLEVLKRDPADADALNNHGLLLMEVGRLEEAEQAFRETLALKPDYAIAHNNLGTVLQFQGRIKKAAECFAAAIDLQPRTPTYYMNLGHCRRYRADDHYLAQLQALADDPGPLNHGEFVNLHFALAKAWDDVGEHGKSFRHLLKANDLHHRKIAYDEKLWLRLSERIQSLFTPALMAAKRNLGSQSRAPVFVVGMPRSGTTLVEQIVASHPRVFGAGEIMDLPNIVAALAGGADGQAQFPEVVEYLGAEELSRLADTYLAAIARRAPSADRIVDKLPLNFAFIGLIKLALPNASIIHVRRDPLDTCFSCFSRFFSTGAQEYSYDLRQLGRYYVSYDRLMEHWRSLLDAGAILELGYEEIVADLERHARLILDFCGLNWDPACVDFHRTARPVLTSSAVQVRQPIYDTSIGRSRPYEQYLTPLIEELGPLVVGNKTGRSSP